MESQEFSSTHPIGARLGLARRDAEMTIAEVAALTKVSSRYIDAIEREEFELIPSRVHTLGFTRAFAKAVNVDESEVVEALRIRLYDGKSSQTSALMHEAETQSQRNLFDAVVLGIGSAVRDYLNALVRRATH